MHPSTRQSRAALGLLAGLLAALTISACTDSKADCLGDAKVCGGTCVELASDNLNCGACGHACPGGQVCSTGTCATTCAAGLVDVGGACVNPLTDLAHCGATASAAGTACAAGSVCSAGTCALTCQAGLSTCGGKCVDPQVDVFHCGASADAACTGGATCGIGQVCGQGACVTPACQVFQFVYTSDPHYGIVRKFQGVDNVPGNVVNQKMVAKINARLSSLVLPFDGGLKSGNVVGPIDFVVQTGDIANRSEAGAYTVAVAGATTFQIQSAAASWAQFQADYLDGLTLHDAAGRAAPVLLLPGNHDVSNAIGFYKPMVPAVDPTAMVEIYNRMMPAPAITVGTFSYGSHRVNYSRDLGGVHFVFVNMWPDKNNRDWIDANLATVPATTPVVLFTHDQPESESKHFTNPVSPFTINSTNKFENLIADVFADGTTVGLLNLKEQQALADWLSARPRIVAYFHGNSNANEFYGWSGKSLAGANLDLGVLLHTFRVDSPMKGNVSATDPTKVSFQLYTVDTCAMELTGREVLWNTADSAADTTLSIGAVATVPLTPRPVFTATASNVTVATGSTAAFTVAVSGASSLQWYTKGPGLDGTTPWTVLPGATGATYVTTGAEPSLTQFRALATNPSGQASSAATLTLQ
jgi:hypothetical protein